MVELDWETHQLGREAIDPINQLVQERVDIAGLFTHVQVRQDVVGGGRRVHVGAMGLGYVVVGGVGLRMCCSHKHMLWSGRGAQDLSGSPSHVTTRCVNPPCSYTSVHSLHCFLTGDCWHSLPPGQCSRLVRRPLQGLCV
jgi:hypothetical protein